MKKYSKGIMKSSEKVINHRRERYPKEKDARYDGWQDCFRNVKSASCYGKTRYC